MTSEIVLRGLLQTLEVDQDAESDVAGDATR
jgi:hypothetical protein